MANEIVIATGGQVAPDRGSDHAAMSGDIDAGVRGDQAHALNLPVTYTSPLLTEPF